MLGGTKTVTVVTTKRDKEASQTIYQLTSFTGCSWRTELTSETDQSGRSTALHCKVRIPLDSGSQLVTSVRSTWLYQGTLATLDDETLTALTKRRALFRVTAYHDNRDGVEPHLYLEGTA
jgi:hypothetical protein